jgi:hypothetical protein
LLLNTADCVEEFQLIEIATACTSSLINGFAMEVLKWLKKHNVEWLEDMANMRRKAKEMDQLVLTEFQKFAGYMAAIAITQKNSMSANLSLLRLTVEMPNPLI